VCYRDLAGDAGYRLLQRQLHTVGKIGTPVDSRSSTTASASTKDIAEDILKAAKATTETAMPATHRWVDTRMSKLIIGSPFLAVAEYLIGLFGLLEFRLPLLSGVAIRVVLHRHTAVGFFQIGLAGIAIHPEHFVIISFGHIIFQLVKQPFTPHT
jgi:hypothetical protein